MHIHHSILDLDSGSNAFSGPQGGETDLLSFYWWLKICAGSDCRHGTICNSYRRYVKDHAAPINLEWGRDNRTTGIEYLCQTQKRDGSKIEWVEWIAILIWV